MTHAAIPDGEVDGAREAALDEMESDLHASYQAWRTKGYAEGSGNQFRRAAETIAQLRARLTALEAEKDALKAEVAGLRDLLDGGWTRAETAPAEWENTFLWRWNGSEVDEYFLPRAYNRVHQHCGGWFFKKIVKPTPPGVAIRSLFTSQGESSGPR